MKKNVWKPFIVLSAASFLAAGNLWAQTETEDKQLETTETEIDQQMSAKPNAERAQALAKQYNVETSVVEDLRGKGRGWGEINTELAMAQHLSKTEAAAYPTLNDALTQIESQRTAGKGWGAISKDLGFKLGPVVSASRNARERLEKMDRMSKPERMNRPERLEKPERPGKPERPENPKHTAR